MVYSCLPHLMDIISIVDIHTGMLSNVQGTINTVEDIIGIM